jgi:hypothetical protein
MFFLRTAADHPRIKLWESLERMFLRPLDTFWRKLGLPFPNVPVSQLTDVQHSKLDEFYKESDRLIHAWAAKHNLDYEWVQIAALDEFTTHHVPKLRHACFIQLPETSGRPAPHWEWWRGESERDYRKRRRAQCNREAREYIRAVKLARQAPKGVTERHYRWAAERVCLKWKWEHIAISQYNTEDHGPFTSAAANKAVLPILRELGIQTQIGSTPRLIG